MSDETFKNYYNILEVETTATEAEIKKAYRKLSLKWHPDRLGQPDHLARTKEEAEAKFKEIGEAYAILGDPVKKQRYDSGVDLEGINGATNFDVDPNLFFQMFMGADMPNMGGSRGFHGPSPFGFSSQSFPRQRSSHNHGTHQFHFW